MHLRKALKGLQTRQRAEQQWAHMIFEGPPAAKSAMLGVMAAPRQPVRVHASRPVEYPHLDLPLQDCCISDDFKKLADCQLICGNENIKCHSQILGMHSPVLSNCFYACKEKVLRLDACMEGIDTEAVKLLLTYMYSPDYTSVITGMDMQQLEKAAVLADIWAMTRFLELCDAHLSVSTKLKKCTPEGVVAWLLRASKCHLPRLQAKCEAYIAARFNELKFCECMEELSRDTWMRLMYISSYKDQGGKEEVLHRWITKGMPPKSNLGDKRTSTMLPPLRPITWQNETPDF